MTAEEQRIAFAEETWFKRIGPNEWIDTRRPRSCIAYSFSASGFELPNPFTNANDAEAIVAYMRGKGWKPTMGFNEDPAEPYYFSFSKDGEMYPGTGQNMRQAICSAFAAYIQSKQPCA